MKLILLSNLLLILIFVATTEGSARKIDLSPGESIQSAVDNAAAGDEIWVPSGEYSENIHIDKEINLYGWSRNGRGDPIVDAGNQGSAIILSEGSDGSHIEGFRVRNSNNGAGIEVHSGGNKIYFVSASIAILK